MKLEKKTVCENLYRQINENKRIRIQKLVDPILSTRPTRRDHRSNIALGFTVAVIYDQFELFFSANSARI